MRSANKKRNELVLLLCFECVHVRTNLASNSVDINKTLSLDCFHLLMRSSSARGLISGGELKVP